MWFIASRKGIVLAQRLETLAQGTPVFVGSQTVGAVEGVYAEGESNLAEYIAVLWSATGTTVLIATRDVETIEPRGVILMGRDVAQYDTLATFDPAKYPTARKL